MEENTQEKPLKQTERACVKLSVIRNNNGDDENNYCFSPNASLRQFERMGPEKNKIYFPPMLTFKERGERLSVV